MALTGSQSNAINSHSCHPCDPERPVNSMKVDYLEVAVRKRLMKIEELWPKLTAFYLVDNAPATNNALENYYSTSLKPHRKKQLEVTVIKDQMKLSALKRSGILARP